MFLFSSSSCRCPIHWSQGLSRGKLQKPLMSIGSCYLRPITHSVEWVKYTKTFIDLKLLLNVRRWALKTAYFNQTQPLEAHCFWWREYKTEIIRTLHDCPSQMNKNLLISNSKLTSDSELIWWRLSTNLSSFVRDSHVGCVVYNGKNNRWQIDW